MAIRDYQNYEENEFNASKKSVESKGETKKLELPFDNFSLKLSNILKRNQLFELDQLIDLEEKDFLGLSNFGIKSFYELSDSLEKIGLNIPITSDQILKIFPNWENKNDLQEKFLEFKISFDKLGLSLEISDALKWNGFFDISDLLGLDEKDLLSFSNFENKYLNELNTVLDGFGLKIPLSLDQSTTLLPKVKPLADNVFKKSSADNESEQSSTLLNNITWEEFIEIFPEEKTNFEQFEDCINVYKSEGKYNEQFQRLESIFLFIDDFEYISEVFEKEKLNLEKKILKFFLLTKFILFKSFDKNQWTTQLQVRLFKNQDNTLFQKKVFTFLAANSGSTLTSISEVFGVTKEMARQYELAVASTFFLVLKEYRKFSKKIKEEILHNAKKKILKGHLEEFGRFPIQEDNPKHSFEKEDFYQDILKLNPVQRLKLYGEYDLEIYPPEYDYHYEYFKENENAGGSYWNNFDNLKEYIYRHAKALGEPNLMPKQTSFLRSTVGNWIGHFGGQSFVAEKLGLEYQGQLVNEGGGGRKFWTEERLKNIIFDVNEFFNQSQDLLPNQAQILDFLKKTDKPIYRNKKGPSVIAAFTKLGNLDWLDVAERFGKKLQKFGQGVNTTFIKSFVRDLGEHLAVLTPAELYVLFQAQGINSSTKQFSRTFDVLIDAVQSGSVNKKDLIDWSNNVDVPSIKELLNLGSDLKRLSKEERELKLLKRRSIKINNDRQKPKILNLSEITKENLPTLDPGKTLRALDKAAGVIATQGSDLQLIQFLKAKATAKLWDSCFCDEEFLINKLKSNYFDKDSYSSQVKESFLEEYNGAKNLEIPSTYEFRDLKGIPRDPKLMQKLVAFRVQRDKRLLNLSGTGTGKTLSAILAVQVCKAQRVFITCPNGVVESWKRALNNAYPDAIVHVKPNNWQINLVEGKTNIVIVNHERLQDRFSENLLEFCVNFQSEIIVIDEIHQSKSRKETTTSQRRELIREFIRISSNLNQEIRVLGLSATPVINNLYEGRSLIELVTEEILADVKGDDINSCMNLYQHFILNSIRMNPGNLSRTKIIKKEIDTSSLIGEIININNSPKLVKYHDLERLFVTPKLKILDEVIEKGVKTIIFITLIEGTLIPISNWLKEKNKKFCVYTGNDKEASEEGFVDSLDEFINGEAEILVATIQCAGTGIDGLQSVCNRAIFFQLPWTSTEFEQSVGRLDRDGTEFNFIDVYLPITYLELPNGDNWSWCESKLERIRSKKDIAKASVDGDLPDSGSMISPQEATKYWLKWLKRLESEN